MTQYLQTQQTQLHASVATSQAHRHAGTQARRHAGTQAGSQARRHAGTQARRHAGTQARSQKVDRQALIAAALRRRTGGFVVLLPFVRELASDDLTHVFDHHVVRAHRLLGEEPPLVDEAALEAETLLPDLELVERRHCAQHNTTRRGGGGGGKVVYGEWAPRKVSKKAR